MAFNLAPTSGADFVKFLKFNGKAGRWYTKNEADQEYEVTTVTAVFDLANIKTGWAKFSAGAAPEYVWDINGVRQPRPSADHKPGFQLNVFSPKNIGGVREWSANSNTAIAAMQGLYQQYEAAPESKQGKLPVVTQTQVLPVTSKHGTNYQPVFQIVSWVDRPDELKPAAAPTVIVQQPAPQPAPSANNNPPPPAQMASGAEF